MWAQREVSYGTKYIFKVYRQDGCWKSYRAQIKIFKKLRKNLSEEKSRQRKWQFKNWPHERD